MLVDLIITTIVVAVGILVTVPKLRGLGRLEARIIAASFALHVVASVATMVISEVVYNGVVDFAGFRIAGGMIADELRTDFWEVAPRMVKLFFHHEAIINVPLNLEPKGGKSTISMWILAAVGDVLFFRSFQATATACALFSFAGKVAIFRTLRGPIPPRLRAGAAAAILLVPSVVYWTSGLIKEGIAVGGLGFALSGAVALFQRRPSGIPALVFGVLVVAMIKPYLLVPLSAGLGAWLYSDRSRGTNGRVVVRPVWLLASVLGGAIGIAAVSRAFPEFSVDTLGEQAARMQYYGQKAAGGSFYLLGNPDERSILGQLKFAPLAVSTALYRPLLFEASNAVSLANAVETTAVLAVSVWLLARKGWAWSVANLVSNPSLAFSVAFSLPLALGVGLVSNNLGTLSRYRCPLVPFFVLVVITLARARGGELFASAGSQRIPGARTRRPVAAADPMALPAQTLGIGG